MSKLVKLVDKRYQIFVSSTYVDLVPERNQIIKAILEMGHIPVGMEMFSAANEEQWETIRREIDRSDYYLILVAHRYGSTIKSEGGISYTEKEFDYAIAQEVPRIGFVIDSGASWKPEHIDSGASKKKLDGFKKKIKARPVNFWVDAQDLGMKVAVALPKLIANSPRPGWARSSSDGERVLTAMARLSDENSRLREEVDRLRTLTSDQVPKILCQFIDQDGQIIGQKLQIEPPQIITKRDYFSGHLARISQMVGALDFMYDPRPQLPASVQGALGTLDWASRLPSVVDMSKEYNFNYSRLSWVVDLLLEIGASKPRNRWSMSALRQSYINMSINLSGYSEPPEPMSEPDLEKYEEFRELEMLLHEINYRWKQHVYDQTHLIIRLQLSNQSRIAAEKIGLRFNIHEYLETGYFTKDLEDMKETKSNLAVEYQFDLISPSESVIVPAFTVKISNEHHRVEFSARLTGRNLPEIQAIDLDIETVVKT